MQPIIACFFVVLVSATVAYGHKDWSKFCMPGCQEYIGALMEKGIENGVMDEFEKCKEMESIEEMRDCFWKNAMDLVDDCDATPSEECWNNTKKFFKKA